jgi:hypothetical protein
MEQTPQQIPNQQPVEPQPQPEPEQQIPVQPEQPVVMPQQPQTRWLFLVLALVIAVAAYAGAAYWQGMWPFEKAYDMEPSPTPTASASDKFTNERYGFSFEYSPSWGVTQDNNEGFIVSAPSGEYFSVQYLSPNIPVGVEDIVSTKEITVDGRTIVKTIINAAPGTMNAVIVIELEEVMLFITGFDGDNFDQIISSFKFTGGQNLKTYQNSTYKYSISYPIDFNLYESNEDFQAAQPLYIGGAENYLGSDGVISLIIAMPDDEYPGTTYAGAFVHVSVNDVINNAGECYQPNESIVTEPAGTIGGVQAYMGQRGGVAGGHGRGTNFYHMFANGRCYEVALTIDTASGSDAPNVDIEIILDRLEDILNSIKFN